MPKIYKSKKLIKAEIIDLLSQKELSKVQLNSIYNFIKNN